MGKVIETVADSIGIEILESTAILTGKGNELHLYSKNSNEESVVDTKVLSVKLANKIHGIKKIQNSSEKLILVYGEKEFVLVEYQKNYKFDEVYRATLSDWIIYGVFLNDPEHIVLLTAHSIVLRFSYNTAERKCILEERISCTDKSTLYCAHLSGTKWEELVVFGGNAFGELLIWQPHNYKKHNPELPKPNECPLIHRILAHNGVIFSIDYDQESQCLITTSDDRAIKWWNVEFAFKNNWNESTLHALSSGYGHTARVFQGRIIKYDSTLYALSAGEDSYFCLWNKNSQLLFKRRQQYGATIWNFVYDISTKAIYTVGSTGNLVAFGLKEVLKEAQNNKKIILLPALNGGSCVEYIAKVKFLKEKHIIGLTNHNNLMNSRFEEGKWLDWQKSTVNVDFKCTVMEVYDNIIVICGYKRVIFLEWTENCDDFKVLYDNMVLKGVIRTFVFFSKQQYLICDDQGSCLVCVDSIENVRRLELPKCKEPWLTTALLLNQEQHLVVSNRQGNMLLYQFQNETDNYELRDIIKHPHGNLGATYLNYIEENFTSALIRSAGHNGALNEFSVDFISNTVQTCSRQIIPMSWIECIEKFQNCLDLFLGFNDNHFVIWCADYDFLLQIPCGGGHRCWHFVINSKNNTISLVFIKNKNVQFYKIYLVNKELIKLPLAKRWHVAPCNAMELLRQTSSSHIAVTAGDDNLVKIHTFSIQAGFKERKEVHSHISNIRCLKVLPSNDNEFLVFSGGGRAQLCVTKVNSSSFHINEIINFTLKQEKHGESNNSTSYNIDPETRLMSLDVKVINEHEFEIYVGCSDGFVRRLKLNVDTPEILLLTKVFFRKCVLQIRYVSDWNLVLVAGTDGILNFFNSTLSECLFQIQHHSSGVNGLSLLYNKSNKSLHILSGGDDQAVSYTELSLQGLQFDIIKEFRKPYLHTAQVCACALTSNGKYGFTSGVDQVLNKIDLNTGQVVDSFHSCVADIKGVALMDDNVCLLYGCGLQVYAFND